MNFTVSFLDSILRRSQGHNDNDNNVAYMAYISLVKSQFLCNSSKAYVHDDNQVIILYDVSRLHVLLFDSLIAIPSQPRSQGLS